MSNPSIRVLLFPDYVTLDRVLADEPRVFRMFGLPMGNFEEGRWDGTIASLPTSSNQPVIIRLSSFMTCHWQELAKVGQERDFMIIYERGHSAANSIVTSAGSIADRETMQFLVDAFKRRHRIE